MRRLRCYIYYKEGGLLANKKQTSPAVAGVASGVLRDPKENRKSTAGSALAQTPEKPKAKKKSKKKSRGK
jgi:hypothetical protein